MLLLMAFGVAADHELVPLEINLPQPSFSGEPFGYSHPNLEPYAYRSRPPFFVPKGTSNVAGGKPVTSSAPPLHGTLDQITDNAKHYWRDSVVELPEGLQWVQVDLKEEHTIYAISVWHFHERLKVYFCVVVQISNDKDFEVGVSTVFNNDFDDSCGLGVGEDMNYIESYQGRLIDTEGVSGRYVRFYSNGNHKNELNHYIEIEVYGRSKNADKPVGVDAPEAHEPPDFVPLKIELPEPSFM